MNKKIRQHIVMISFTYLSISALYSHDFPQETSFEVVTISNEEYDALDALADQQIARGFKPSINSANNTGIIGWLAVNTRRAGSSLMMAYIAAQQWFGWFKQKTLLAWYWVKKKVGYQPQKAHEVRRKR
jgi:hypothetical protein